MLTDRPLSLGTKPGVDEEDDELGLEFLLKDDDRFLVGVVRVGMSDAVEDGGAAKLNVSWA